jgi:hypothetical protein
VNIMYLSNKDETMLSTALICTLLFSFYLTDPVLYYLAIVIIMSGETAFIIYDYVMPDKKLAV